MKRVSRILLVAVLLAAAVSAPAARPALQEPPPAAGPRPAASPALPPPHDPLEEFVPREKVKADSIVALPVDI